MARAFVSYSSVHRPFVEALVKNLGSFLHVDYISFEEGEKIADEIHLHISKSDLFLFLISDAALKSPWVQSEVALAKEKLDGGSLKKVYPIIIDGTLHDDKRIPVWLQEKNISTVVRPGKLAFLVRSRLTEISWEEHPKLRRKQQLFVGRNEELAKIEQRFDDLSSGHPICVVASGLHGIGRRRLIHQGLLKASILRRESAGIPMIGFDKRESIEDLILKVYDLGFSEEFDLSNLIDWTIEEKHEALRKLLLEMQGLSEHVLIHDDGGLVRPNGVFPDWLNAVLENPKTGLRNTVTILIASRFRVSREQQQRLSEKLFTIEVGGLNKQERSGMLKRLLQIDEIELSATDFESIDQHLNGFPSQIDHTARLIAKHGLKAVALQPSSVVDYQNGLFKELTSWSEDQPNTKYIVDVLTEFEFISFELLFELCQGEIKNDKVLDVINDLLGASMIEFLGARKEYFRLNEGIRSYLRRTGHKMDATVRSRIRKHIHNYLESKNDDLFDVSNFFYTLKGLLLENHKFANKFLIPSHYLKTMVDLYQDDRNYADVVALGDRLLEKKNKLDSSLLFEVKYWMCLALARMREERFMEEVQYFRKHEHYLDYDFLFGFYYRMIGNYDNACDRFLAVLNSRPDNSRAKRELVQVYINLEEYDLALELAKENYDSDSVNPYHIQSYFNCLIRSPDALFQKDTLSKLIDRLDSLASDRAKEIAAVCRADFELNILGNSVRAKKILSECASDYGNGPFILERLFQVAERTKDIAEMQRIIRHFQDNYQAKDSNEYNMMLVMTAKLEAVSGRKDRARMIVNTELKFYPKRPKANLLRHIEAL